MKMIVEIDEQYVLNKMTPREIFEESGMDEGDCKNNFGRYLLKEFMVSEIIKYYGERELLDEIGKEAAIKHFGIDES